MDRFRTTGETRATITTLVPAVTREGPLQRPTGVPPAQAPGPVSHMPFLGLGLVHQEWSDGKMGQRAWLWQFSPQVAMIVLITAHLHFISRLGTPALLVPPTH